MDLNEFIDKVLSKKNKKITDEVFLLIQNDKELMQVYLALADEKGHGEVNRQIGRKIKRSMA